MSYCETKKMVGSAVEEEAKVESGDAVNGSRERKINEPYPTNTLLKTLFI